MRARILLLLVSTGLALGLAEVGFRVLEAARDDSAFLGRPVIDPILERRMPPSKFHHDANGFRNDAIPAHADVVVLGDSQTWGVNVRRGSNWPSDFARLTGSSVYNMGMVGYGPAQYAALMPQARALADTIVVQLYLGNDFADAVRVTYALDHYQANRLDGFSGDATTAMPERLPWIGLPAHPWWARSAIGRVFLRSYEAQRHHDAAAAWAVDHPDDVAIVRGQPVLIHREAVLLDLADPVIAEGARLTRVYLDQIKAITGAGRLVVLLFPAKTSAVRDLTDNPRVRAIADLEATAAALVETWCRDTATRCVNPIDRFRSAIAAGETLYPPTTEIHPTAPGYQIVAGAVAEALREESAHTAKTALGPH